MKKIIQLGETLRLEVPYADILSGDPVDPTTLTCTVMLPDATLQTITYPSTGFVKVSTGNYFVRIQGTQIGTHHYAITALTNVSDTDIRTGMFDVEEAL